MISLDTETTGVDFWHGARPFFITTCNEHGEQRWWEWDVDPLTRRPIIPEEDVAEVQSVIDVAASWARKGSEFAARHALVGQNIKFDVHALDSIGVTGWPWEATYDTLLAGHLLASNQPHNLTDMVMQYLGRDIEPHEKELEKAVGEGRRMIQQARLRLKRARHETVGVVGDDQGVYDLDDNEPLAAWRIAGADEPDMPSAGEKTWKYDTWLPRALAQHLNHPPEHRWWTVLAEYANADSAHTLALWKVMEAEIRRRGLWAIYEARLRLLPVSCSMESDGVSLSQVRLDQLEQDYTVESDRVGKVCVSIASSMGHEFTLPKSGNNGSLLDFAEAKTGLDLPAMLNDRGKNGRISLNKSALEYAEDRLSQLEPRGKRVVFLRSLRGKRKRDTAVSYLKGYRRFAVPSGYTDYLLLHPNLNPTGTDTLRWSSNHPNEQNISKQDGFNLRYAFGPAPGREWWSLDAKNIELRIPAYESGEREMVDLFNRMNDPPYYGSYHLLIFDILHPDKFALHGVKCKEVYESTWYQWTKNGNFAVTYGAMEESGTADRAYHVPGAHGLIKQRLKAMTCLGEKYIAMANRLGYVETLPDKSVDPKRGYPLLCTRSEWGKISPTVPFNYHVQGTACWWMTQAMIRVHDYLRDWGQGRIVLQVHDELVLDFPKEIGVGPEGVRYGNRRRIRDIQRIMEKCGEDIGVPTPVTAEYHEESWAKGVSV